MAEREERGRKKSYYLAGASAQPSVAHLRFPFHT